MEENSIKNKKLLCLLLSVVMTASVLNGCTTKNNASEEETKTTEESLNTKEHEPLILIDAGYLYNDICLGRRKLPVSGRLLDSGNHL